jgi:ferredoxin
VCPAHLPIMIKNQIVSVECTGCMDCVAACPVKDTLEFGTKSKKFTPVQMAAVVVMIFLAIYAGANLLGGWKSGLTDDQYRYHVSHMNSADYGHPGMK